MLYVVILVLAVVLVWNLRNNSKLKADVAKLKAEAAANLAKAENVVKTEVGKVL